MQTCRTRHLPKRGFGGAIVLLLQNVCLTIVGFHSESPPALRFVGSIYISRVAPTLPGGYSCFPFGCLLAPPFIDNIVTATRTISRTAPTLAPKMDSVPVATAAIE
ncbi:hypothetical protein K437DRAFT_254327 [Tilletiaria anomala UBC 951]|uniref:Uncharacterized protein n=1 Tax=Tilletiaria anomala (strain ATCC 24038 / CBS 436.72 / UBC 951) TaxID=1037660 RepID=A0A066WEK6_TILAU|nr:uncharacterized protein K437DRAFT_254327 [Tilletiaria anomala UBC 951]KDN52347.1 hypothetical protein K437DRAFT_254327 [Tilletiaria anomala UBC 951]